MVRKLIDVILLVKGILALLIVMAILLLIAGGKDYWQVWCFGLVNSIFLVLVSAAFANRGHLIQERLRPGPETKGWDRLLWAFFGPANLAILIVAALDAGRFRWTSGLPVSVYFLGYLGYICGGGLHLWSIRENPFYSSTVSIREDGAQTVVDHGPYRFVRHPGYAGIILMVNGMAIALGSLWALIPSGCSTILLILRTCLEDRALQEELSGYREYAFRVKHRLLPRVW